MRTRSTKKAIDVLRDLGHTEIARSVISVTDLDTGNEAEKAADAVVKSVNKSAKYFNKDAKPAKVTPTNTGYTVGLPSVFDADTDFTINDLIEKVVDGMGVAKFKYKSGELRNLKSQANNVLFEGPGGWLAKLHSSHTDKRTTKKVGGKSKTVRIPYWMSHITFWQPGGEAKSTASRAVRALKSFGYPKLADRVRRVVISAKQLYVRCTHGSNPMSKYGHAMFVIDDKIDRILSYGPNMWIYDGRKGVEIDSIKMQVWKDLRKDIETGSSFMIDYLEDLNKSQFFEELNPDNIINDAGVWDNYDFISWFCDKYKYSAVITDDGAVVFDKKLIRHPTQEELSDLGLDD